MRHGYEHSPKMTSAKKSDFPRNIDKLESSSKQVQWEEAMCKDPPTKKILVHDVVP